MNNSDVQAWSELCLFDDGEVAHDITTAVLAMEYEASLIDLSDDSIVAGFGSELDPDSPHAKGPFVLTPRGRVPLVSPLPGRRIGSSHYEMTESEAAAIERRTKGGPWSLRVPTSTYSELNEVLDTLLEERNTFESKIKERDDTGLRVRQWTFGVLIVLLLLLFCAYVLFKIVF